MSHSKSPVIWYKAVRVTIWCDMPDARKGKVHTSDQSTLFRHISKKRFSCFDRCSRVNIETNGHVGFGELECRNGNNVSPNQQLLTFG